MFILLICIPLATVAEDQDMKVLQIRNGYLVFSVSPDADIQAGDELSIFSSASGSGDAASKKPGKIGEKRADSLVRITELYPEAGIARILYGSPKLHDILVPRSGIGIDLQGYMGGVLSFTGSHAAITGLRISGTRDLAGLYPVAGIEFPAAASQVRGLPVFPYLGMQLLWEIGRFQIIPSGVLGAGIDLSPDENGSVYVDYLGGAGEIGITYLFSDSWRVLIGLGYSSWLGISGLEDDDRYGYNGITLRGGMIWKL